MRGIRTLTVRLLEFYGLVELPFSLEKTTYAYDYLPDRRRRVESFWSFLLLKVALGILMQRELHALPQDPFRASSVCWCTTGDGKTHIFHRTRDRRVVFGLWIDVPTFQIIIYGIY